MFIDETEVIVKAGNGGPGIVSFGKKMRSGPDGGNGGKGGDIYFETVNDITLLRQFVTQLEFEADNGQPGNKNRKSGKDGDDLLIKLPVGVTVTDKKSGDIVFETLHVGEKQLVCTGGKGGRGNFEFRSSRRTTPTFAQPGLPGEKRRLKLVLKLIADFGLIGLPNAGKSSLINELTNAKSKVADYPFTTLSPNLGVLNGKIIADIPGLIEGASVGRGLGISFLKHIEKVGLILHCISSETKSVQKDYNTIRRELGNYNKTLLNKPEIVLITKSDLADSKTIAKLKKLLKGKADKILTVSIHDWESLEVLKSKLGK